MTVNATIRSIVLTAAIVSANPSAHAQSCRASYYQSGHRTANGERFNPDGMTAAHRTLPFGTMLRVSWRGKSILVRLNDRGPFINGRCLDLSREAARRLGFIHAGYALVAYEIVP